MGNNEDGGAGGGAGGTISGGEVGENGPDGDNNDVVAIGGTGGSNGGGAGGNGGDRGGTPTGADGIAPGGGGGGRGSSGTSGNGAGGRVIITVESVLPITLQSFTAQPTERTINLEWITSSELDNEIFHIERSVDGRVFEKIGELPGSGTTELRQTYTFADKNPLAGQNFYRLKQIDYDGTFDYSPVASAVFAARGKLTLFPTVTRDLVTIVTGEDAPATVRVFDLNGRLLQQQEFGAAAQRELRLGELPAGTYLISVETAGQTYQERVVKQ